MEDVTENLARHGKRKMTGATNDSEPFDSGTPLDSDDEVLEAAPPPLPRQQTGAGSSSDVMGAAAPAETPLQGEDEELQFIGRSGALALSDFPHARENCASFRFADDPARTCEHCFCYVCDIAASSCTQWKEHCHATHTQVAWRQKREACRNASNVSIGGSSSLPAAALHPGPGSAVAPAQISCESIMKRVEQVYPVERQPAKLTAALRPYQKQSLAFMVDVESSTDPQLAGRHSVRGGWLADEMVI